MQKSYLMTLFEIAETDNDVLLLLADSGSGYDELFKKELPNQIFDFGIAEENMVLAASGMASCGKIPFVYTAGAFLAYRSMEFIRDDVCLQNRNVKIVGMGTGLAWSTLGPTHHTTEDIGILRSIPNLTVLSPSCPSMTAKCVRLAYEHNGPVYIRIGMGGEQELYNDDYSIRIGGSKTVTNGTDVLILSHGTILSEVVKTVNNLQKNGISARLIDMYSVSPIDQSTVISEISRFDNVVTVEEHSIIGGLGSAVAEIMAENSISTKFKRIGLNHQFAKGYGTHAEVRKQNMLDSESITEQIINFLRGN